MMKRFMDAFMEEDLKYYAAALEENNFYKYNVKIDSENLMFITEEYL